MKKNLYLAGTIMLLANISAIAQVGAISNTPNKDAVLDLNNTNDTNTKGLLLPNVTLTGINNAAPMTNHVKGMKVYNTASAGSGTAKVVPGEYYNDGTKWIRISSTAWLPTGNAGTSVASNSVGTTDATDFATRTNNAEQMRITSTGNVLMGTTVVPAGGTNAKLSVSNTTAGAIQIKDGTEGNGKYLLSDTNGKATWQAVDLGENAVSIDLCSVVNTPTKLTVFSNYPSYSNYQLIPDTVLTVTVPSGYTSSKLLLHWDVWGDVADLTTSPNQGSLRYYIKQTGAVNKVLGSVAMSQWTLYDLYNPVRSCVPISYIVENLAPGTYTFQLGVSRESEANSNVTVTFWGVQGKGEVYVK